MLMIFKQLMYFIAVVDCNSFTEAAYTYNISQSAISQQIKALEKSLKIELMVRKTRSFHLTNAGEYLYYNGKSLLNTFENIKKETVRLGQDNELSLKVGYPRNYGGTELQMVIRQFTKTYPEINISITPGNHEELFHMLVSGNVDLVISEQRRSYNDEYVNFELYYSDCYIEITDSQIISNNKIINSNDLKGLSCILIASKESEQIEKEFYEHTLKISDNFLYAQTLDQARMLVLGNRGYLPIDAFGNLMESPVGIKRIPFHHNNQILKRNYFACWSKIKTNYYIEEFAMLLRNFINND